MYFDRTETPSIKRTLPSVMLSFVLMVISMITLILSGCQSNDPPADTTGSETATETEAVTEGPIEQIPGVTHKILARNPLGNPNNTWAQDDFVISNFFVGSNATAFLEAMKEVGYNVIETAWAYDHAETALTAAKEVGIQILYQNLNKFSGFGGDITQFASLTEDEIRAIVDAVKDNPMLFGYYIWDEPQLDAFATVTEQLRMFSQADPDRLAYTVALPSYSSYMWTDGTYPTYLESFARDLSLSVLSMDYYPYNQGLRYSKNSQLDKSNLWLDLGLLRQLGDKYDLPIWFYHQGGNDWNVSNFEHSMVRMNMYAAIMYGCKGLQTYDSTYSAVAPDGTKGIYFEEHKQVNHEILALGNTLMALESVNVIHSDDVVPNAYRNMKDEMVDTIALIESLHQSMDDSLLLTGTLQNRVSVGEFKDAYGNLYLMVLNRDVAIEQEITLDLKQASRLYEVSRVDGKHLIAAESTEQIKVTLAAGDAILYRVQPATEEPFTIEYRLEK